MTLYELLHQRFSKEEIQHQFEIAVKTSTAIEED
jgi:hypothetical protein